MFPFTAETKYHLVWKTYKNFDGSTFARIDRNPKRCPPPLVHFIKKFFEHTIHLYNGIQLISLLHSFLIQRITDRNGITSIRCMMLSWRHCHLYQDLSLSWQCVGARLTATPIDVNVERMVDRSVQKCASVTTVKMWSQMAFSIYVIM